MTAIKNQQQTLRVAYTSDPDDAFAWWAIIQGKVNLGDYIVDNYAWHIQKINEFCEKGFFDVAAVSSAAWPYLEKDYFLLSVGASVGRGYGPVLASAKIQNSEDLAGKVVAIPGGKTTGGLLLKLFYPEVKTVCLPFDQIAQAILDGGVDAGVLIHEELLNWGHKGLQTVQCLGAKWQEETGLPIPVGVNIVHRRLHEFMARSIASAIRESLIYAKKYQEEAFRWALGYSCQEKPGIASTFIDMFANEDTLGLDSDCIEALRLLYDMSYKKGLIPSLPKVHPINPWDA